MATVAAVIGQMTSVDGRDTTTRRLCAGAYLNPEFRERLLREIHVVWKRRVAPSYGYDLAQLLAHAWRAWWIDRAVDAGVVLVLAAGVVLAPMSAVLAVGLLGLAHSLVAVGRTMVGLLRAFRRGDSADRFRGVLLRLKFTMYVLAAWVATVAAAGLVMRGDDRTWPLRGGPVGTVLLVAAVAAVLGAGGAARQWQLDRLRPGASIEIRSRRLLAVRSQQEHPFTLYSGYRPFVGSGRRVGGWSFAQRLVHGQDVIPGIGKGEEFTHPPFRTAELVRVLKKAMTELASTEDVETRLAGLVVRDRVFIRGSDVESFPEALEDPPSPAVVDRAMADPSEQARHHIACQVEAWKGELVTTVFVHVSMEGRMLNVSFVTYALTPTPVPFHVIDQLGGTGSWALARRAGRDAVRIRRLARTPLELLRAPALLLKAHRAQRDTASYRGRLDVGAAVSGREMAGDKLGELRDLLDDPLERDTTYFQYQDVGRHSKIIERRLLATIETFLKDHGVDTSEFVEQASTILNNGIINAGSGAVVASHNTFGGGQGAPSTTTS